MTLTKIQGVPAYVVNGKYLIYNQKHQIHRFYG